MKPINDPNFWKVRLEHAVAEDKLHQAVYHCTTDEWEKIESRHKAILDYFIDADDSVLDVGCGYGRLVDLMPRYWRGQYVGIDLSPEFIQMAESKHWIDERVKFHHGRIEDFQMGVFDWAVLISIKRMVCDNLGQAEWEVMERAIKSKCHRMLILEYSVDDLGVVEAGANHV